MPRGGGGGEKFPLPISYLVTCKLFETLMYCVPPNHLKPTDIYGCCTEKIYNYGEKGGRKICCRGTEGRKKGSEN